MNFPNNRHQCPQAAVTEIPGTGRLTHNRNFFLTVLEGGKSKMKALAESMSREGPSSGS